MSETINGQEVTPPQNPYEGKSIEELREILKEKETILAGMEETYGKRKYLIEGGITAIDAIREFLIHDVQVAWKGTQANGVIKLMEILNNAATSIERGDSDEFWVEPETLHLINVYLMNTVTTGYTAAVRVQKLYDPLRGTFNRYDSDAQIVNDHVTEMNTLWRYMNEIELAEQLPPTDEVLEPSQENVEA